MVKFIISRPYNNVYFKNDKASQEFEVYIVVENRPLLNNRRCCMSCYLFNPKKQQTLASKLHFT